MAFRNNIRYRYYVSYFCAQMLIFFTSLLVLILGTQPKIKTIHLYILRDVNTILTFDNMSTRYSRTQSKWNIFLLLQ